MYYKYKSDLEKSVKAIDIFKIWLNINENFQQEQYLNSAI